MQRNIQDLHIDIDLIEARAHRLRAETMRNGVRSIRRWVASSFTRGEEAKL